MTDGDAPPLGVPLHVWIVIDADGERHFLLKEPLEGFPKWTRGQNVRVVQYDFATVIYDLKKKKKAP